MRAIVGVGLTCVLLGCTQARPESRRAVSEAPLPYVPLLEASARGTEEDRYAAILALGRHDSPRVRAHLADLATDDAPMIRNAASRALAALDPTGAIGLIENLGRAERTFVVTDAIHHLRDLFPGGPAYEPNLGYRHQTEQQEAWRVFLRSRAIDVGGATQDEGESALRVDVEQRIAAFDARAFEDAASEDLAVVELWRALGELAPSRHPEDVHVVAEAFGLLTEHRPRNVALWNNLGLAALNDGQWARSEAAYRRARTLAPDDAQLANDLAILLEGLGRRQEAEAAYRRAIELAPEDDVAWANLGDVLRAQRRYAEAREAYGEAERRAPEKWPYHRLWMDRMPDGAGPRTVRSRGSRQERASGTLDG